MFVRIDVRAWSGIALELSESVTLCCNDNSLEIPIPFIHMTQETSHCIYSTLPFRFHILDVLSKQYPE